MVSSASSLLFWFGAPGRPRRSVLWAFSSVSIFWILGIFLVSFASAICSEPISSQMNEKLINKLLSGVKDPRVREAFARVDRACFVPEGVRAGAWSDHPLPIEDEATISQPSLVAKMTEMLKVGSGDRVLEIGTGSGYQTAILAELAAEVETVEYSSILSRTAQARLVELGYRNIYFRNGDGSEGWEAHAPYDRIIATVAFPEKPDKLMTQLSPDQGIAIIPVGQPRGTQYLTLYKNSEAGITEERLLPVRFLSLR